MTKHFTFTIGLMLCVLTSLTFGMTNYTTQTLFTRTNFPDLTRSFAAKDAFLMSPTGICAGQSGDFFISDSSRHSIFRMLSDGTMSLFAGLGFSGNTNDGYPSSSSLFNSPSAISMAPNGDLYIADTGNDKIRIVSNGIVRSVAGSFSGPLGVFVSDNNRVYIADTGNNLIKKYDPTTKSLTILAGGGYLNGSYAGVDAKLLQLSSPKNIHVVSNGNDDTVYFTDNERVKSIDSKGIYQPIGETQSNLYGIFVVGTDIYTTSDSNHILQKRSSVSNQTLVIGNYSSLGYSGDDLVDSYSKVTFNKPKSILVKNSIIYMADSSNNCIRKIDTINKIVSTIAGGFINHAYGESVLPSQIASQILSPFFYKNELYFIEEYRVLRKISNGLVKTVFGTSLQLTTQTIPTRIYTQLISQVGVYDNGDVFLKLNEGFAILNLDTQVFTRITIGAFDSSISRFGIYGKSFAEGVIGYAGGDSIRVRNGSTITSLTIQYTTVLSVFLNMETDGLNIYYFNGTEVWKSDVLLKNPQFLVQVPNFPFSLAVNNGKILVSDSSKIYEINNGSLKRIAGLPTFNVSGTIVDYYGYNGESKSLDQTALQSYQILGYNGDIYIAGAYSYMGKISNSQFQIIVGKSPNDVFVSAYAHTVDFDNGLVYFMEGNQIKKFDEKTKKITPVTDYLSTLKTVFGTSFPLLFVNGRFLSTLRYSSLDKKLYISDMCRIIQMDPVTLSYNLIIGAVGCGSIDDNTPVLQAKIPSLCSFTLSPKGEIYLWTSLELSKIDMSTHLVKKLFVSNTANIPSADGLVSNTTNFGTFSTVFVKINGTDDIFYYATVNTVKILEKQSNGDYYMRTLVGNGVSGYNGDNLPPLQTSFDAINSIHVKSNGDIIIADTYLVRIYVKSEGVVKIIAGNSTIKLSYWSPDLKPTETSLLNIRAVSFNEKTEDVYVNDFRNGIRKLTNVNVVIATSSPRASVSSVLPKASASLRIVSGVRKLTIGSSLMIFLMLTLLIFNY